jgi:putative ABC transport system permease protein
MVMRLLRLLMLRSARRRPLRTLLTLTAVAAGTSMALSVFVVRQSVHHSLVHFERELAGPAGLRVVGATRRGAIGPELVERVAGTRGVAAAVPVVQAVTAVETDDPPGGVQDESGDQLTVLVLGVDCRAEALIGPFGCSSTAVADQGDRPLAVGPDVPEDGRILTGAGLVPLRDVPRLGTFGGVAGGRVVVYSLASAQRLFARGGGVDVVYVLAERGTGLETLGARLERAVGPQNAVLTADQGPPELELYLGNLWPLFTLLALFAMGIGASLVYDTVSLTLDERRHEFAVVAALGATPRMLRAVGLTEACALGAAGGLVGAVGGLAVARSLLANLSMFTERAAGVPLELHLAPVSFVLACGFGVAVALLAAWVPVHRTLRAQVDAEVSGPGGRRVDFSTGRLVARAGGWASMLVAGLVLLQLGRHDGGLATWQVQIAAVGFVVATLGLVLACGSLAPLAVRPFGRWLAWSAPGRLAVGNLVRSPARTGAMTVAVAVAGTTGFVIDGYVNGVRSAVTQTVADRLGAVEVSSANQGFAVNLDVGLAPPVLDGLAEVPGVAEVVPDLAPVLAGSRPGEVVSVEAADDDWLADHDGEQQVQGRIDAAGLHRGGAIVNTSLARAAGLRPGDLVRLPTPAGVVTLPVQAVVSRGGLSVRTAIVTGEFLRALYGDQPIGSAAVRPEPGVSLGELARRIRRSEVGADLQVSTPADVARSERASVDGQLALFWALQRALLVVCFAAILSTLLLVGLQRSRELGMLAAVGMTPSALRHMVLAEGAMVAVTGVGLSLVGGFIVLWALLEVSPVLIGWAAPLRLHLFSMLLLSGLTIAVVLLAAVWPACRAARTDVSVALRDE